MMRAVIALLVSCVIINQVGSYRILGIFPLNSRSHEMMFEGLMKGLARRGHQVDVVTHFSLKNPPKNYRTVVNLNGTMENLVNNFTIDFVVSVRENVGYHVATTFGNKLCNLLNLKEMQDLIHNPPNDPPYDILITEAFGSPCFMGIGHHFNIPIVAASSAVEYPWVSDFTGNNDNPATVPNALYMAFGELNFWQRLKNTISYHKEVMNFQSLTEQFQTDIMRKYIHPNIPNIREVEKSVALTLVNSHPILFGVKPVLPTVVQTASLHIEENDSTLPQNLKKWMDQSEDGVLYFTFGSMVVIESLPLNQLKALYASFEKIAPVRVLMKIADKTKLPPGLPNNVLTLPWIPQQAVLAHHNTKAFMTHGGLMGSQEALYFGIPMIGVPLFADQPRNVASFVAKKMSIKIDLEDISENTLDRALQAILYDPTYSKNAKYYSKLFRDNPLSSMDTAEFWIKYIIRNGPNTLRPTSLHLTWWQLALLDVYIFIALVSFIIKLTCFYTLKLILRKLGLIARAKQVQHEKKTN